ncbi:MAG: hypothetical protein AB7K24_21710 [Gemmataceae bacterium]
MLTIEVLRMLALTEDQLRWRMRHPRFPKPKKNARGDYVWTAEDIERLREWLTRHPVRETVSA